MKINCDTNCDWRTMMMRVAWKSIIYSFIHSFIHSFIDGFVCMCFIFAWYHKFADKFVFVDTVRWSRLSAIVCVLFFSFTYIYYHHQFQNTRSTKITLIIVTSTLSSFFLCWQYFLILHRKRHHRVQCSIKHIQMHVSTSSSHQHQVFTQHLVVRSLRRVYKSIFQNWTMNMHVGEMWRCIMINDYPLQHHKVSRLLLPPPCSTPFT